MCKTDPVAQDNDSNEKDWIYHDTGLAVICVLLASIVTPSARETLTFSITMVACALAAFGVVLGANNVRKGCRINKITGGTAALLGLSLIIFLLFIPVSHEKKGVRINKIPPFVVEEHHCFRNLMLLSIGVKNMNLGDESNGGSDLIEKITTYLKESKTIEPRHFQSKLNPNGYEDFPVCPSGGTYSTEGAPKCSIHGYRRTKLTDE